MWVVVDLFSHDTCKTTNVNYRHTNNNKTANIKDKSLQWCVRSTVHDITRLKLQKEKRRWYYAAPHWHNGDLLQSNITFSFCFCSFSCVIYVQSTFHVVVNFYVFVFYLKAKTSSAILCVVLPVASTICWAPFIRFWRCRTMGWNSWLRPWTTTQWKQHVQRWTVVAGGLTNARCL